MRMLAPDEINSFKLNRLERIIVWGILALRREMKIQVLPQWLDTTQVAIKEKGASTSLELIVSLPYLSPEALLQGGNYLATVQPIVEAFSVAAYPVNSIISPYDPSQDIRVAELLTVPYCQSLEALILWASQKLIGMQIKYNTKKTVAIKYLDVPSKTLPERVQISCSLNFDYSLYSGNNNLIASVIPDPPEVAIKIFEQGTTIDNSYTLDNLSLAEN